MGEGLYNLNKIDYNLSGQAYRGTANIFGLDQTIFPNSMFKVSRGRWQFDIYAAISAEKPGIFFNGYGFFGDTAAYLPAYRNFIP